ncbi:MAG: HNH endonuclease signature motif containing protein [Clostridium sp.]
MYFCEICNKPADIHHIVHRSEGGFELSVNYKYLCHKHHRGKDGPHQCLKTDIEYKLEMQKKLFNILTKEYYTFKELQTALNAPINTLKRITKNIKLYKEGYKTRDIIYTLMGCKLYSEDCLQELAIEELLEMI